MGSLLAKARRLLARYQLRNEVRVLKEVEEDRQTCHRLAKLNGDKDRGRY